MQKFRIVKVLMTLKDAVRHTGVYVRPDRLAELEASRNGYAYIDEAGDIWYKAGNEITLLYPERTPPFFDAARDAYIEGKEIIIGDVVRAVEYFEANGMTYFKMRM